MSSTSGSKIATVPGGSPSGIASISTSASYPSSSSYARCTPRMPKSVTVAPSGSELSSMCLTTSTPKPSSPRKMLPIPATRTRGVVVAAERTVSPRIWISSGWKYRKRPCHSSMSAGGIVVQRHSDVLVAVHIGEHTLHRGELAGVEEVVGVGAPRWLQPHACSAADLDPADSHRVGEGIERRVRYPDPTTAQRRFRSVRGPGRSAAANARRRASATRSPRACRRSDR